MPTTPGHLAATITAALNHTTPDELDTTNRHILTAITHLTGPEGTCRATHRTIATAAHLTGRSHTIGTRIGELRRKGWLQHTNTTAEYIPTIPLHIAARTTTGTGT